MKPADCPTVITGASNGLGKHLALELAARGFPVALTARNANALTNVSDSILAQGGTAIWYAADLQYPEQVERFAERVTGELGAVRLLINAAGIFGPIQTVQASDPSKWVQTLQTNLVGPYLTCRAFVGGMLENGWGRIVNISSAASLHPPGPLNSAYAVSKVGLNQLTRQLAAEVGDRGVTVNAIHPGEVKTEMWADIRRSAELNPDAQGLREWVQMVQETGGDSPDKTVDLVIYLCSPEADRVNGRFLWIQDGLQRPIPSW